MIVIPLTHQEEDVLRLIAHGACPADLVQSCDLEQLSRLGLVAVRDGHVTVTGFGEVRLAQAKELHLRSMIRAARARQSQYQAA